MKEFETISWGNQQLALIIYASFNPSETTFLTQPELNMQVGFVVYPEGGRIHPHVHLPVERNIFHTSEVLVVKQGRCLFDVYSEDHELVATRELNSGDVVLINAGGHGFRMLDKTTFLEIKQGPYLGLSEKERF